MEEQRHEISVRPKREFRLAAVGSGNCVMAVIFRGTPIHKHVMRYRFIINGVGMVPKAEFNNLWHAFMWIYGVIGERDIEEATNIKKRA